MHRAHRRATKVDDERNAAPATEETEGEIAAPTPASWAYAESFIVEDEVLSRARARASVLGVRPILPGIGGFLRAMGTALGARAVVEVGTGTGVSGVYLLRGMPGDGVLTTIDVDPETQRAARLAFTEAGVRQNRARLIPGRALDVLPRLTDGAYDLVFLDAEPLEYDLYLDRAVRLLRPGGMLAVGSALWGGRVADPAQRDPSTSAMREVARRVRENPHLQPSLLPCGDGLLLAVVV